MTREGRPAPGPQAGGRVARRAPRRLGPGRRLLLLLLPPLLLLAAAEGGLRLFYGEQVDRMLASRAAADPGEGPRILCIGDSYTFGLYYRAEESYPGRLEQILNHGAAASGQAPWRVLNSGIPAQNTAQMTARFAAEVATLRPRIVVVLAGHNNRWNLADPERRSFLARFLDRSVLVRLVRIAATEQKSEPPASGSPHSRINVFDQETVGVDVAGGAAVIDVDKTLDRRDDEAVIETCVRDFETIAELCAEHGATPVFCSYPSPEPGYAAPAEASRRVAARHGVPFVDFRTLFAEALESRPYTELLIPGDRHPTARGYFLMALDLATALEAAGLVRLDEHRLSIVLYVFI